MPPIGPPLDCAITGCEDIRPADFDALPRALAWRPAPNTIVYLHPLPSGGLALIGWHTDAE